MATGQPVGSKYLVERSGIAVSSSTVRERARRARGARAAHAPAHVGGPRPDRSRVPLLRRRRCSNGSSRGPSVPARPDRDPQRGRRRAAGDDRDALAGDPPARARLGAAARDDDRPPRRGALLQPHRHGRRDHVDRRRREAGRRLRRPRRPGSRRLGGRVPERAPRRACGSARTCSAAGSRTRGSRARSARSSTRSRPAFVELGAPTAQQLFVGGAAGLLDEVRAEELEACQRLLAVLEKRAALLELLGEALDPRRPFVRVGRARPSGAARRLARRRELRAPEPHARRRQPARPAAHGLRQGDPHGARGRATSCRASSRPSTRSRTGRSYASASMATTERDYYELLGVSRDATRRGDQEGVPPRSRASCTRTSPRRPTRRSASARSPRPTRCCRRPRRASSTTATGTPGCARGGFTPGHFDFGNLSDLFSAFFGDDLFGAGPGAAARGAATSAAEVEIELAEAATRRRRARSRSRSPSTCEALRRRRRRAGDEPRRVPDAAAARACSSRSRAASSASSCARSRARAAAAAGRIVETPCADCDGAGRVLEERDARGRDPGRDPRRPADPHLRRGATPARRRARRRRLRPVRVRPRPALRPRGKRHLLDRRPDDHAGGARRDGHGADARRRDRARLRAGHAAGRGPRPARARACRCSRASAAATTACSSTSSSRGG